jgi:streptogramin lyase
VPGTYVLRLTASDGKLSASDELTIVVKPKPFTERTYTLDADFDQGNQFNVIHDVANQLQLDQTAREFDFLWVSVSSKGTIVKINTTTGQVIGEYFTSPAGQPKNPSRTTVDLNGNVWATNRDGNSVVHVGLVEKPLPVSTISSRGRTQAARTRMAASPWRRMSASFTTRR